jgi:hypothetical protein
MTGREEDLSPPAGLGCFINQRGQVPLPYL